MKKATLTPETETKTTVKKATKAKKVDAPENLPVETITEQPGEQKQPVTTTSPKRIQTIIANEVANPKWDFPYEKVGTIGLRRQKMRGEPNYIILDVQSNVVLTTDAMTMRITTDELVRRLITHYNAQSDKAFNKAVNDTFKPDAVAPFTVEKIGNLRLLRSKITDGNKLTAVINKNEDYDITMTAIGFQTTTCELIRRIIWQYIATL